MSENRKIAEALVLSWYADETCPDIKDLDDLVERALDEAEIRGMEKARNFARNDLKSVWQIHAEICAEIEKMKGQNP